MPHAKKPPKKRVDFNYMDGPAEPLRHIIIEALISDENYNEYINQALDAVRSVGHGEVTRIKVVEDSLDEALFVLKNRHMEGMPD